MGRLIACLLSVLMAGALAACGTASPLVIGHRGASGELPEHTLAAYREAIAQCADHIEPDLVPTSDGTLVARHENEIGATTDVARHPEFADRQVMKSIDGIQLTGWFTEDFTASELATLRAVERIPQIRPGNADHDGEFSIPSLAEILTLVRGSTTCAGESVGLYIELKHSSYFASAGLRTDVALVTALDRDPHQPVIVQSRETAVLRGLAESTDLTLVQLLDCENAPWDRLLAGDDRVGADWVTPQSLAEISGYAAGIGPCKGLLIPRTEDGRSGTPTSVVQDAHEADLVVHPFTFRRENRYLPLELRSSTDPNEPGDLVAEIDAFLDLGVDGFFTDHPRIGVAAVAAHVG